MTTIERTDMAESICEWWKWGKNGTVPWVTVRHYLHGALMVALNLEKWKLYTELNDLRDLTCYLENENDNRNSVAA